jgi:hypothetical protein
LDEEEKFWKKMQGRRLWRGVVGVAYRNLAHLLDVTNYVK